MKKVISLVCLVVTLTTAEHTIDLSSAPLSHEVRPHRTSEFGIGYLMPHLKAKQKAADIDTTALMHGVDIFMALNFYATERFGFSFGTGAEFTIGNFKKGLYECNYEMRFTQVGNGYEKFICNENTNNWKLASWYFYIGLFGDILQFEKVTVRAFSNVGYSFNWLMEDGDFESELLCTQTNFSRACTTFSNDDIKAAAELMPISFGLRFIFAENHGIELVGKYYYNFYAQAEGKNRGGWNFRQALPIIVDTEVSRDYSFGVRYVYEFKD